MMCGYFGTFIHTVGFNTNRLVYFIHLNLFFSSVSYLFIWYNLSILFLTCVIIFLFDFLIYFCLYLFLYLIKLSNPSLHLNLFFSSVSYLFIWYNLSTLFPTCVIVFLFDFLIYFCLYLFIYLI